MSRKLVSKGFLNKNTKALRPDKETGKWIGKETANGQFGTIKPLWSNTTVSYTHLRAHET